MIDVKWASTKTNANKKAGSIRDCLFICPDFGRVAAINEKFAQVQSISAKLGDDLPDYLGGAGQGHNADKDKRAQGAECAQE